MAEDSDRYLSLREVADYSGLSEGTVRRLLQHPNYPLPHYRVGHRVLVKRSEFDSWLQASGSNLDARARNGAAADRLAAMADAAVRAIRGEP